MSRTLVVVLVSSVLALSACTGLQGGEPHDDDSGEPIVGYVTDEYRLSFGSSA